MVAHPVWDRFIEEEGAETAAEVIAVATDEVVLRRIMSLKCR